MFRRKKGKKLGGGIARGYDHRPAVANTSASDLDKAGRRTILEKHLEFNAHEPASKRARTDSATPELGQVAGEDAPMHGEDIPHDVSSDTPPPKVSKKANGGEGPSEKKNTPSYQMAQWTARQQEVISRLLEREHHPDLGKICACGRASATARCQECGQKAPQCLDCVVQDHEHLHYHWIDRWNGRHFERVDLGELGHVIHLGHGDKPCMNASKDARPMYFVIVHTNGVHRCQIQYCQCVGSDEAVYQLITAGLWPSTLERPETAFTQDLLRHWHVDWDISHKSAQDFYRVLQRLTNNAAPDKVENRYKDLLSASRVWRHFTMVKRSGRHHNIVMPHRPPQTITVPCFTCPWPDFNLPDDWRATPDRLKYIYRIVIGCDGNHSLHKKAKREDPNDVSLAADQGYFVNHKNMTEYLEKSYENEDTLQTCSGFQVLKSLRPGKFRFLVVSGIIGTFCKHVLFRTQGIVDMQTGERTGHALYAIIGGLQGTELLEERALTYDIACIIIRNILKRCREYFPAMVPIVEKLKILLPKLHLYAHKDLCQIVYALAFASGFGLAHGEGVETPWAEFNIAGLPTREMTAGGRHDALTDLFSFWNWGKVERMAVFLSRKLTEAYKGQERTTRYFAGLTALAGPQLVAAWLRIPWDSEAPTPLTFRDKEAAFADSPFLVNRAALPTADRAYTALIEEHHKNPQAHTRQVLSHMRKEYANFLRAALDLEQEMLALRDRDTLRKAAAKGEIIDLGGLVCTSWQAWRRKVDEWRVLQNKLMPCLWNEASTTDDPRTSTNVVHGPIEGEDDNEEDEGADEDNAYVDEDLQPGTSTAATSMQASSAKSQEILGLPSDLSAAERTEFELDALAEYERVLRIGQAFDLLDDVRQAVKHLAAYIDEKKDEGHTTKDNTRSADISKFSRAHCQRVAKRYNYVYDRLVALRTRPPTQSEADFHLERIDLTRDLTIESLKVARAKGASKRSGSWIWWAFEGAMESTPAHAAGKRKKGAHQDTEDAPDTPSSWMDRAQWFRAWQEKLRYDEAVNIICADFRATIRGYDHMARLWLAAAERPDMHPGERAYAHQHHTMFSRMRDECQVEYNGARKQGIPADTLDQSQSIRDDLEEQCRDTGMAQWEAVLTSLHMA